MNKIKENLLIVNNAKNEQELRIALQNLFWMKRIFFNRQAFSDFENLNYLLEKALKQELLNDISFDFGFKNYLEQFETWFEKIKKEGQ